MTKCNCTVRGVSGWTGVGAIVVLAGLMFVSSCSKNSTGPESGGSVSDAVFNADGGFVITEGMLDKPFNKITFPGTHNSYSYGWGDNCNNQDLSIANQLENGIQYIELDIDKYLRVNHNGFCFGGLNGRLEEVRSYAEAHPHQVITIRISDLSRSSFLLSDAPTPSQAYKAMNQRLTDLGLGEFMYNWDASKADDDVGRCYIPDPWPTLREMIDSGRNIMFLHHSDYATHHIIDEAYVWSLSYSSTGDCSYASQLQEQFCRLMPFWDPSRERQEDGPDRLFYI